MRLIVRRQPRAAGDQLAIDDLDGWRLHAIITNVGPERMSAAAVEAHHRLRGGIPEDTIRALKAKANLQKMLAAIPLTDDERAAVDDGHTAVDALLARLADVPTPAGPTPHELGIPPTVTLLPLVQVAHRDFG